MKRQTAAALVIASFCAVASFVIAGEFKSVVITPKSESLTIDVPDIQFLAIRNFTQEGGSQRGVVTVTADGQTNNVLTAALIDQGLSVPPEFVKKVVIPGPAQVTVAPVSGATLFITYRRGLEPRPNSHAHAHRHCHTYADADAYAVKGQVAREAGCEPATCCRGDRFDRVGETAMVADSTWLRVGRRDLPFPTPHQYPNYGAPAEPCEEKRSLGEAVDGFYVGPKH